MVSKKCEALILIGTIINDEASIIDQNGAANLTDLKIIM